MDMTGEAKQAWGQVGERFAALGRRIATHYQEAGSTDEDAAAETRRAFERVANEVADAIGRGVETVGSTFRDQEAGAELTEALNAFGEAVTATAHETGDAIRGLGRTEPPPPPSDDVPPEQPAT
jgi:hypothetical protein